MKLLNKLQNKTTGLLQYKDLKGEFHHMELSGEAGTRMLYKGEEYISWSINNYLGLMNHTESILIATKYTLSFQKGKSYFVLFARVYILKRILIRLCNVLRK